MRTRKNSDGKNTKTARSNAGFYIALAVCIMTVAAAAWTTYGSIVSDQEQLSAESSESEMQTANDVSGEAYDREESTVTEESSVPEKSEEPQQSSAPQSSSDASTVQEPAGESKPESPEVYFPVEGSDVVKPFSITKPVFSKTMNDWRVHRGIDIKAKEGAAVRSVSDGVVTDVLSDPLFGNTIIVSQSGCSVSYCGLTERTVVKKGDHIDAGTVIGYVGKVPCEQLDEPHIHVEAVNGERHIDPMALFDEKLSK